ncbi:hypothetical protein ACFXKG_08260 [Streptomyces sp. NPDC059255]|uniref:hypothetical protein n=1 Tax=Streptomyces sp. NPDC059255 TaxID=3346793 RepID=UPI0036B7B438
MTNGSMILPGDVRTRVEICATFGGSPYAGICPSHEKQNVVLYSDPEVAERLGYHDGWLSEEDALGPIFEYTGAGMSGDQSFSGSGGTGNKAILRHAQQGRTLHLFVREGKIPGTGTKTHRYVGEFAVDEEQPFVPRRSIGADERERTTIVFRLRPTGDFEQSAKDTLVPALGTTAQFVPRAVTIDMLQAAAVTEGNFIAPDLRNENNFAALGAAASGKLIPVKSMNVTEFARAASAATTVRRKKALLIESYVARLEAQGHSVGSFQIKIEGHTSTLRTDFFDATDYVLYEAQGSSDRDAVRIALGRLLDYRRYIKLDNREYEPKSVALLPSRPDADMEILLASHGTSLIYREDDGSFREAA